MQARELFLKLPADFHEPDYHTSPAYLTATRWYNDFRPAAGTGYASQLEFARARYDWAAAAFDKLDDKADSLFKLAGTFAVGTITAAKLFDAGTALFWWLSPAVLAFGVSIICAIWARRPVSAPAPLRIADLLDLDPTDNADGRLAASLHCAVDGYFAINDWKSRWVERATWAVVLGVLLMPLIALHRPTSSSAVGATAASAGSAPAGATVEAVGAAKSGRAASAPAAESGAPARSVDSESSRSSSE